MEISVNLIRKLEQVEPTLRDVLLAILEEIEHQAQERVTKVEFNELKEIVAKLTYNVNQLTEAQKRTEERLDELTQRVNQLAEAQKKTEQELQKLIGEHQKTREQVEGLANTVGYILEDRAIVSLPRLLKRDFDITLKEGPVRKYIYNNQQTLMEVNIIAKGEKGKKRYVIIGEGKSQLSKKDVDRFIKKRINLLEGVFKEEMFPILVTHMISEPDVEEYAKKKGIKKIYYSYEFVVV